MQLLRVRVEKELVAIETVALGRRVRTVDAETVKLAGPQVPDIAVKYTIRVFGQPHPCGLENAVSVEQTDLDGLRVLGENREVHAMSVIGCSLWVGETRLYL